VPALGAHQVHLFVRIVDALARLDVHERDFAALVVGEVDEVAAAAKALFPRQYPAAGEHAVNGKVAGIEARPFDRHQVRQAEVDFVGDQFSAGGEVDRVAGQGAHGPLRYRLDHVAAGHFGTDKIVLSKHAQNKLSSCSITANQVAIAVYIKPGSVMRQDWHPLPNQLF